MIITGYSLYVNTAYYETYESLDDAMNQANRFNTYNYVDIIPMVGKGEVLC